MKMASDVVRVRPHLVLEHKDLTFRSGREGCPVHEGTPLHDNIIIVVREGEERHTETETREPDYQT